MKHLRQKEQYVLKENNRAQFSEKAGRAGEWDEALLGRGGV